MGRTSLTLTFNCVLVNTSIWQVLTLQLITLINWVKTLIISQSLIFSVNITNGCIIIHNLSIPFIFHYYHIFRCLDVLQIFALTNNDVINIFVHKSQYFLKRNFHLLVALLLPYLETLLLTSSLVLKIMWKFIFSFFSPKRPARTGAICWW